MTAPALEERRGGARGARADRSARRPPRGRSAMRPSWHRSAAAGRRPPRARDSPGSVPRRSCGRASDTAWPVRAARRPR